MSCVPFQGRKSRQIHVCTINNFVFSPPQSWFHEYNTLCSYRTIISKQLELSSYYWPIRYTSLLRLTAGHGFVVFVVSETRSKLHRNPLWFRCLRADYRIFPIQTIISNIWKGHENNTSFITSSWQLTWSPWLKLRELGVDERMTFYMVVYEIFGTLQSRLSVLP